MAETIIDLVKSLQINSYNKRIIEQVIASAGSIGANYCEATEAESRKDFIHKISITKKEAKETKHWLRLLAKTNPEIKDTLRVIYQETHELILIFSKTLKTAREKQ